MSLGSTQESRASSVLEYLADTFAGLGRTLEILPSTDLLCHSHALFWSYRPLAGLPEGLDGFWITSQIFLATNQDERKTRAEVHHLGNPLEVYR